MRYWEFLIQQEGDQTWLPLETRQVEILEGRYRMAAHTSYDSTSVEIRVSQLLLDEMPPRRRVRKRKANTNDSGLLAIFPFIKLSPGRWEVECNSPNVIDDFLGEGSWHYSVQLQVTPRDEYDWEPDWLEKAAELSQEQSLDTEHPGNSPDHRSDAEFSGSDSTAEHVIQASEFQLQLKQQAYVAQLGQPLTLSGQLSPASGAGLGNRHQLLVELRDPQTANTVQEMSFDIPHPPSPFSVTLPLPESLSTQVILGAMSLLDRNRAQDETVLASASFTVTLGLAQMLDAIANQPNQEFEEEISIFPGSTEAFVPPPEKAKALLSRETPFVPKDIIPSEGLTLPPQLAPPGEQDLDPDRQPELPTFPAKTGGFPANRDDDKAFTTEVSPESSPTNPDTDMPEELVVDKEMKPSAEFDDTEFDDTEFERPDVESASPPPPEHDAPVDEPPAFAEPQIFELSSIEEDDLDLELATAALNQAPASENFSPELSSLFEQPSDREFRTDTTESPWGQPAVDITASIDREFKKLQLRERFWQKLSLFTQDGYRQSLEVQRALKTSAAPLPESNHQSNEFVVYDTPTVSHWREQPEKQAPIDPIQIYPPVLDIPQQELIAGEWMAIRVRVPAGDYQPYVKVWMNDLQTRTVLDSPRLLMQFTPNDKNELETLMRVQIPQGCLELQFAAISVDMTTLQESRKVVQNRRVMPPDDSLSVFDDWDI